MTLKAHQATPSIFYKLTALLIMLLAFFTADISAQQLDFKKTKKQGYSYFNYTWVDHSKQQQTLQFSMQHEALFEQFRKLRRYNPQVMERNVFVALKKYADSMEQRREKIIFPKRPHAYSFKVFADTKERETEIYNALMLKKDEAITRYLAENYYIFYTDIMGQSFIKPDHIKIASESLPIVQSIADAAKTKFETLATREVVDYFLSWVQSIPYETLENRLTSQGSGFVAPNKLILENQGDCDSKSTLFISLMRALYPNMSIAMVYLPNHALVGLEIPYIDSDKHITIDNKHYVLMEPTGPALLPAATIGQTSEQKIDSEEYKVEIMPL